MIGFAFLRPVASVLLLIALLGAARAETEKRDPQIAYNNACRTCHSMKEGDHRLGPSLYGIVGRKAGSVEGYPFSPTMQSSGIVWDETNLDKFIADPDAVVRGNNMKPYGGIDSAEQRSEIINYLKSISGN